MRNRGSGTRQFTASSNRRARTQLHGADAVRVSKALSTSSIFTEVAIIIGAIEDLSPRGVAARERYNSFRVARLRLPRCLRGRMVALGFSKPAVIAVAVAKLTAAVMLLGSSPKSAATRVARCIQLFATVHSHVRAGGYGQDGSDHALLLQQVAQLVASASATASTGETAAHDFLAQQAVVSYTASGMSKLVSPAWRSGAAMQGISRATAYGHRGLYTFVTKYPAMAKGAARGTIIVESIAPVALLLPPLARRAWQLAILSLHAGIAVFMGLNRFFWAFTAFHPLVDSYADITVRKLWNARGVRR